MNSIKCKWCDKEFEPKHWNIKYCSDDCRQKAYKSQILNYQEKMKLQKQNIPKCVNSSTDDTFNEIKEIGEIRNLLRSLKNIKDELRKKCELYNVRHETLEKQRILLDHQLESYKNIPPQDVMINNNSQRYGIMKARRMTKLLSKGTYEISKLIPENPEEQFVKMLTYQEELNEKYDKQKEWNTDKWKISGIHRITSRNKKGER